MTAALVFTGTVVLILIFFTRSWGWEVAEPPTHEERRMIERCRSDHWEQWTVERGLAGLEIGFAEAWPLGYRLRCRLNGKLTFADVEDRGMALAVGLGLTRARQALIESGRELTAEEIAPGMVATHREWRGSVILISRAGRSDRCDVWIALHDRLALVAAGIDDARAARKAAKEAEEKARHKEPVRATPAELAAARADHARLLEEFRRTSAPVQTAPEHSAEHPRPGNVSADVIDVLSGVPDGLSAAEIALKAGHSLSRVYEVLKSREIDGSVIKVGRRYMAVPDIET